MTYHVGDGGISCVTAPIKPPFVLLPKFLKARVDEPSSLLPSGFTERLELPFAQFVVGREELGGSAIVLQLKTSLEQPRIFARSVAV